MKKLPYSEGFSVFLVPLRTGGYARGVVARSAPKGKTLFGYFFGPRFKKMTESLDGLHPSKAILKKRFGDLGLYKGTWPVVGAVPNWNRSEWKMPDFARREPLGRMRTYLVRYSDDDPSKHTEVILEKDNPALQNAGLAGAGSIEISLTKLLGEKN